jgi:putative ABC transport system permease protein
MTFLGLITHNLWARKARTLFTGVAVAVGVATVVTLGVVTSSLKSTAVQILKTGRADFTVAQKGVSDVLSSSMDEKQLAAIQATPGVDRAIGALITIVKYNADNPAFIEIGLKPDEMEVFGVRILSGRAPGALAKDEVMLGYRAAQNLNKGLGDPITLDGVPYKVVGTYTTGNDIGDAAAILPQIPLQAYLRQPGAVTLAFVRVKSGYAIDGVRKRIEHDQPNLTTVRQATEFGRVDRNLQLISAADRGSFWVALLIGAVIVSNTMLLSFFERTREFGLLRAVGWSRRRVVFLVMLETLVISILGAALGVGIAFLGTYVLQQVPQLKGILHPQFDASIFSRALYVAFGVGMLGAIYPAFRAALLVPLEALRRE